MLREQTWILNKTVKSNYNPNHNLQMICENWNQLIKKTGSANLELGKLEMLCSMQYAPLYTFRSYTNTESLVSDQKPFTEYVVGTDFILIFWLRLTIEVKDKPMYIVI